VLSNRDLEIRGAGDILGKKQSGTINSVGYGLYTKLLNDAVEKLKKV
jgi:transcription-repair coupling factor (superfamily II helicase)